MADDLEPMNEDAEAVYDAEIAPLMTRIIAVCRANRIPMVCSFQYSGESDPRGPGLCTSRVPFDGESEKLRRATRELFRKPDVMAFTITTAPANN